MTQLILAARRVRSAGLAALFCAALPAVAVAQAAVDFSAPGADDDLERDLRNSSLLLSAETQEVTDPQELLAAARAEYGRLIGALYANGHYGGIIRISIDGREAASFAPLDRPGRIGRISIVVEPGPVYLFSRADIGPLAPETELPNGYARGEPAASSTIEDAASAAVEGWRAAGRAEADVAGQSVVADHGADRLAAAVGIAPGPLVRFGQLGITGNQAVRTERIREIAGFPTGEVFDPEELEDAADRLRRTGTFSSVALTEAETLGPGNTLDVAAAVAEELPRRFGFGAEVSTTDGATLSTFWLHRNLLGGAERLRLEGEISGIGGNTGGEDYSFAANFGRPATFTPDTDLYVLGEVERLDEPDFTSNQITIGAGLRRIFSDTFSGEAGVALRYSEETNDAGTTEFLLLTFPLGATLDRRDNQLSPTEGYYVDADLTPFVGLNDSDSGGRVVVDSRGYLGFGADNRFVAAGRLQFGSILGASLTGVPNDFRFYSGGADTVRGQEYQDLGVDLPGGVRSGGASFVGVQAELRAGVTENISLVGFADYGFVGPDSFPDAGGDSHAGVGLGLRYDTTIGPIRLDVATPVDREDDDSRFQVYIGIGQAF